MEITKSDAKKLAKKYLLDSNLEDGNIFYAHTKGVINAVKLLSKRCNMNSDFLETAAWVHDIGQVNGVADHAISSIEILKKEGFTLNEKMTDCIMNHGNSGNPKTREGEILNISDKISIIEYNFLKELLEMKGKITSPYINFVEKISNAAINKLKKIK